MSKTLIQSVFLVACLYTLASGQCPKGDLSGNGVIDMDDVSIFAAQYLGPAGGSANLNGLGGIDLADFTIIAKNWQIPCPTLLINEFMASNNAFIQDPYGDNDDWIEIYNAGSFPVDIGGMYITDNLAVPAMWQIPKTDPAATTIAPDGYILIWADREMEQGPLHVDFKLSASGDEDIGLYTEELVMLDSVSKFPPQNTNDSYGRLPNGGNTWQNFLNAGSTPPTPLQVNGLLPADRNIVINEVMYHVYHRMYYPYYEPEITGREYIELYNTGSVAVDLEGWHFTYGIDYTFPAGITLGPDSYIVVTADLATFTGRYPSVTNVLGNWSGRLSNSGETIELVNANGVLIDRFRYADEGDWSRREEAPEDDNHTGWEWSNAHDAGGKSLELINADFDNACGQNWTASWPDAGTPGTINSVAESNVAPVITDFEHIPVIPNSSQTVTVRAAITDELDTGVTAELYYRQDVDYTQTPNTFSSLTMYDDGLHNDGAANDGVFAAQVPAQPDGTIIDFYVQATDATANSRTWPAPVLPSNQQLANALYQVNDAFDLTAQQQPGTRPMYQIIMTDTERYKLLVEIGNGGPDYRSDAQMNATFISFSGTDIQVRYNVGVRIRGSSSRLTAPMNYRVNFPHDNKYNNAGAININSRAPHAQVLGSVLCQAAGIEAADAILVETRVNGQIPPTPPTDWVGTYAHVEVFDSQFAEAHFPDDDNGNLYRGIHGNEYADFRYEGTDPDEYRDSYIKNTNANADDWTDLIDLVDRMNNYPDSTYEADISPAINIDQWMRWFASQTIIGNVERGLARGSGDDYAMYSGISDPRFVLLPHDLDSLRCTGDDDVTQWAVSGKINDSIFRADDIPAIYRFLHHPDLETRYYDTLNNLISTTFSPAQVDPLIQDTLGSLAPQWFIDDVKQYFVNRNNYILTNQIP